MESPEYEATTLCDVPVRALAVQLAVLALRATAAHSEAPSMVKLTVPVGSTELGTTDATAAVKVTFWPLTLG